MSVNENARPDQLGFLGILLCVCVFYRYREILAWSVQSALHRGNPFHGGMCHYDLICLDLILSEGDFHLYVLEMNSDCHMSGGGAYSWSDAGKLRFTTRLASLSAFLLSLSLSLFIIFDE